MEFVKDHQIKFQKGSPSKGGNIEIHCPFCGTDDRHKHLGLSLNSTKWGCWRNKRLHSGKHPKRLIRTLLKCSDEQADILVQSYFDLGQIQNLVEHQKENKIFFPLSVPKEFRTFKPEDPFYRDFEKPFRDYLKSRGIDPNFCINRFDLRYALSGDYNQRLIIPIRHRQEWYSWTARDLSSSSKLRYKACEETNPAEFLLDMDNLKGGSKLFIVEGFFDAAKAAQCWLPGISCTAFFGKNISNRQINYLIYLSQIYEEIILCLDQDAWADTFRAGNEIGWYIPNLKIKLLDGRAKDFAALPIQELSALLQCV